MAEGVAVEQIHVVERRDSILTANRRKVVTQRSTYILISEVLALDGKSSTVQLTQQYWETVPGGLESASERRDRQHRAELAYRNGRWVVVSFDIGAPAASVADKNAPPKKTFFISVDPEHCGFSPGNPLGAFAKMDDLLIDAGLNKGPL